MRATILSLTAALAVALGGCSALPSSSSQPTRFDLGTLPQLAATPAAAAVAFPSIAMDDIQAVVQSENSTVVLYRLPYADGQALHTYAYARWSQPPAVLVQQRIREIVGRDRTVLSAEGGALPPMVQGKPVPVLQLSVEEFSQQFASPQDSAGVVRLRATVVQPRRGGDQLLGQRIFSARQPAKSANAAGGVSALALAVNEVGEQMRQWLTELPATAR